MQKLNRTGLAIIAALLVLPTGVYADSWSCEHNNLIREVKVERDTTEPAPCSVVYNKETEGLGSQVLWNASNDGAYCEEKARGLVEKLQGWGWECTEK
jgi:hypothetical protein